MAWKTVLGDQLEYPFMLHHRLARQKNPPTRDDILEVMGMVTRIHEAAQRLDTKVSFLTEENTRLRHENEFMLKLINQREDAT